MDEPRLPSVAGRITVREVLELPSVAVGVPTVLAGRDALDSPVRWVHVCEQPDVTEFINGGELVLTSGTGVPPDPNAWAVLGRSISNRDAAGLVVELGVYHHRIPDALIQQADASGLPVVSLSRSIRFVDVTRAVHERLLDGRSDRLRQQIAAQQAFTNLALAGAGPDEIVARAASLLGCPVVLEDLAHRVLACDPAGQPLAQLLRGWEQRSRDVACGAQFDFDQRQRWLLAQVGERDGVWGRLVVMLDEPADVVTARGIAELAVNTLVLRRLINGNRESVGQQARRTLLTDILRGAPSDEEVLASRARALGVDLESGLLTALAVRTNDRPSWTDAPVDRERAAEQLEVVARVLHGSPELSGLAAYDESGIAAVVALSPDADRPACLTRFCLDVQRGLAGLPAPCEATIGAGAPVRGIGEIERSYMQARDAAAAATLSSGSRPYYTVADTHLYGLLHPLRDDPRLQAYVERELGPLLRHDERHDTDLVAALRAFLAHRGNKSTAATALSMSRPSLYERLRRIGRILATDLDDHEAALSLDLALSALDCIRQQGGPERRQG